MTIIHGDKYKEQEADAMDMYKEFHCSKRKGFTPDVQLAIVSYFFKKNSALIFVVISNEPCFYLHYTRMKWKKAVWTCRR